MTTTVTTIPTTAELAETIKVEVLEGIAAGWIPETVATFSELHDYCDANTLGDQEAVWHAFHVLYPAPEDGDREEMLNKACDHGNATQTIVHNWLAAGRPNATAQRARRLIAELETTREDRQHPHADLDAFEAELINGLKETVERNSTH